MRVPANIVVGTLLLLLIATPLGAGEGQEEVIRLAPREAPDSAGDGTDQAEASRRGFDYFAFEARLQSLWFQRKTLLANGRDADARAQLERIRDFSAEEGIQRLEHLASALVAEAHRFHEEGNHAHALTALEFADAFDPDRPQIHMARAAVLWESGGGTMATARALARAMRGSTMHSLGNLSLPPRALFVLGLAALAAGLVFALLMLLRHQARFRHEVEEWAAYPLREPWPEIAGWVALAMPLITWVGVGWTTFYWLVVTFRFMSRSEKAATLVVLAMGALVVPVYGVAVGLYGTSANPAVRATVTAVEGEYDPDRIVKLRDLVEAHPEDPVYRFLLAGLYKNGRYFEEAFEEYQAVLERDPSFVPAHINVGNIFYVTGHYAAAITSYHEARAHEPGSFLAHFNLHLAQSEDFHFKEAEQSLDEARRIDSDRVTELLSQGNMDRPPAQDASLSIISVWEAAIGGRSPSDAVARQAGLGSLVKPSHFVNTFGIVSASALLACFVLTLTGRGRPGARSCIRCGRPFCHRCKSQRDAQEYCGQCLHLYVLRDGLAPETKAKKLYEVERHERRSRRTRRLSSLIFPGSVHILRGKTGRGLALLVLWFALLICAAPGMLTVGSSAGVDLATDLLLRSEVPTRFDAHPGRMLALVALAIVWLFGNWRAWRTRET